MNRRLIIAALAFALVGSTAALATAEETPEPEPEPVHFPEAPVIAPKVGSIEADGVGLVDPSQGLWYLRTAAGDPARFFFGNPGDYPFMGDWNCNGVDTPGLYRQSDGYVYLSNANRSQVADISFFFGNPGDIPIPGDFNGDGCDTVSIYRPGEQRFYIINALGTNDGGLGAADYWFAFGNPGDTPFSGDFDGDGLDEIGLHRATTGLVYFENQLKENAGGGAADNLFIYGDPGDKFVAGDWNANGKQSPAIFRPSNATVYERFENTQGNADKAFSWGESDWFPVAGQFGTLSSSVSVGLTGAPDGLEYAVESLYLQLELAPWLPAEFRSVLAARPKSGQPKAGYSGTVRIDTAFGGKVGVAFTGADTILLVSSDGIEWRVVGAHLASVGAARWYGAAPRHVAILGGDTQNGPNPMTANADAVHVYTVDATDGEGAITGLPRDTYVHAPHGWDKVARTMRDRGPATVVLALEYETGFDIDGYVLTSFGSSLSPGYPGFIDLVDAFGGLAGFPVPYATSGLTAGTQHLDGSEALKLARGRSDVPYGIGDIGRNLSQGAILKAGVIAVQALGIDDLPSLLAKADGFVRTNLSLDDIMTLGASVYTVNPGSLPTPTQFTNEGWHAFDNGPGTLPNLTVKGCNARVPESSGNVFGWVFLDGNMTTFADLADGDLDTFPAYRPGDNWGVPGGSASCEVYTENTPWRQYSVYRPEDGLLW